jgi:hypothetical protein
VLVASFGTNSIFSTFSISLPLGKVSQKMKQPIIFPERQDYKAMFNW